MAGATAGSADRLSAAIDDFLLHLRVERGLSPATLAAYRTDLLDFAASRGASAMWDTSAEVPDPLPEHARITTRRPAPRAQAHHSPAAGGLFARLLPLLLCGGAHRVGPGGTVRPAPSAATAARGAQRRGGRFSPGRNGRRHAGRASAIGRSWSCCTPPGCEYPRRSGWTSTTCRWTMDWCAWSARAIASARSRLARWLWPGCAATWPRSGPAG